MCWCIKLSCTIITNLLSRCYNDLLDYFYKCYGKLNVEDQYRCSSLEADVVMINSDEIIKSTSTTTINIESFNIETVVFKRGIELEIYFKAVNRDTCEQILFNRVCGSCLVRPYKQKDMCIKYICSVYAKNNYFHLYIRKIESLGYALGLEKQKEKYFRTPNDIINYYRLNKLQCTNKQISICIVLIPIT